MVILKSAGQTNFPTSRWPTSTHAQHFIVWVKKLSTERSIFHNQSYIHGCNYHIDMLYNMYLKGNLYADNTYLCMCKYSFYFSYSPFVESVAFRSQLRHVSKQNLLDWQIHFQYRAHQFTLFLGGLFQLLVTAISSQTGQRLWSIFKHFWSVGWFSYIYFFKSTHSCSGGRSIWKVQLRLGRSIGGREMACLLEAPLRISVLSVSL